MSKHSAWDVARVRSASRLRVLTCAVMWGCEGSPAVGRLSFSRAASSLQGHSICLSHRLSKISALLSASWMPWRYRRQPCHIWLSLDVTDWQSMPEYPIANAPPPAVRVAYHVSALQACRDGDTRFIAMRARHLLWRESTMLSPNVGAAVAWTSSEILRWRACSVSRRTSMGGLTLKQGA